MKRTMSLMMITAALIVIKASAGYSLPLRIAFFADGILLLIDVIMKMRCYFGRAKD